MTDVQGSGQFVERHDGGIATPPFQSTDVLLTEARKLAELLLCQALQEPDPFEVISHELAHIHVRIVQKVCTLSLPTIICIPMDCSDEGNEGMSALRVYLLCAGVFALTGCAIQRAVVAQGAQDKMVGMSRGQILACMGPPATKAAEGTTEVWSYGSGNDHTTTIGTGFAQTNGSISGERQGSRFSATGQATTTSLATVNSSRRFCTVNVVMTDGRVSRLNYAGPTGGILTGGEQCAFAVQNCLQ